MSENLLLDGFSPAGEGTQFFVTWGMESGESPGTGTVLFKRDTNIYISKEPWQTQGQFDTVALNVKDFSFNRQSVKEVIGRQTLDPTELRGVAPQISALSPVSFSFVTYIDPLVDTNVTSPEEYLWVSLMGVDSLTSNPTSSTIDFANGNVRELQELTLWFDRPDQSRGNMRIDNCVVDRATINFNKNELCEITWEGRGLTLIEDNTPPVLFVDRTGASPCLKNKLTTILFDMDDITYNLALIGGSIIINNNNTFYGRSKLGEVSTPTGHYTGKRSITGNLNFYLKTGTNASFDLYNEILIQAGSSTFEVLQVANITLNIGGVTAPNMQINIPQAIFNIGRQDFSEVVAVEMPFTAKEETNNYTSVIYQMP